MEDKQQVLSLFLLQTGTTIPPSVQTIPVSTKSTVQHACATARTHEDGDIG